MAWVGLAVGLVSLVLTTLSTTPGAIRRNADVYLSWPARHGMGIDADQVRWAMAGLGLLIVVASAIAQWRFRRTRLVVGVEVLPQPTDTRPSPLPLTRLPPGKMLPLAPSTDVVWTWPSPRYYHDGIVFWRDAGTTHGHTFETWPFCPVELSEITDFWTTGEPAPHRLTDDEPIGADRGVLYCSTCKAKLRYETPLPTWLLRQHRDAARKRALADGWFDAAPPTRPWFTAEQALPLEVNEHGQLWLGARTRNPVAGASVRCVGKLRRYLIVEGRAKPTDLPTPTHPFVWSSTEERGGGTQTADFAGGETKVLDIAISNGRGHRRFVHVTAKPGGAAGHLAVKPTPAGRYVLVIDLTSFGDQVQPTRIYVPIRYRAGGHLEYDAEVRSEPITW